MPDSVFEQVRTAKEKQEALIVLQGVALPLAVLQIKGDGLTGELWIARGEYVCYGALAVGGLGPLIDVVRLLSVRSGEFSLAVPNSEPPASDINISLADLVLDSDAVERRIKQLLWPGEDNAQPEAVPEAPEASNVDRSKLLAGLETAAAAEEPAQVEAKAQVVNQDPDSWAPFVIDDDESAAWSTPISASEGEPAAAPVRVQPIQAQPTITAAAASFAGAPRAGQGAAPSGYNVAETEEVLALSEAEIASLATLWAADSDDKMEPASADQAKLESAVCAAPADLASASPLPHSAPKPTAPPLPASALSASAAPGSKELVVQGEVRSSNQAGDEPVLAPSANRSLLRSRKIGVAPSGESLQQSSADNLKFAKRKSLSNADSGPLAKPAVPPASEPPAAPSSPAVRIQQISAQSSDASPFAAGTAELVRRAREKEAVKNSNRTDYSHPSKHNTPSGGSTMAALGAVIFISVFGVVLWMLLAMRSGSPSAQAPPAGQASVGVALGTVAKSEPGSATTSGASIAPAPIDPAVVPTQWQPPAAPPAPLTMDQQDDVDRTIHLAEALHTQGNEEGAAEAYAAAVGRYPGQAALRVRAIQSLTACGRAVTARAMCVTGMQTAPSPDDFNTFSKLLSQTK